jgi:hypothetical protein
VAEAVRTAERPAAGTTPRPGGDALAEPHPSLPRPLHLGSWVTWAAVALIGAQLVVRGWVASVGSFYWDDLRLIGQMYGQPLFSPDVIFQDHDGHFMPGAYVVAGLVTRWAPLEWWLPVASLLLLQAIASLAVLRLLRTLLGRRPILLLPLICYLFSPLTLASFAWWANALNALPMQAALAWMAADAVRLVRTDRRRYAISGVSALVLALAFFEKAVLVPVFALAVAWLLGRVEGRPSALREALRRGRPLWWPSGAVLALWLWAYLTLAQGPSGSTGNTAGFTAELLGRGVSHALLPTLLGGPWFWGGEPPGMPWTDPPFGLVVGGLLILLVTVVWTLRNRHRTGWVWCMVAGYVAACFAAVLLSRLGPGTPVFLLQLLRYTADVSVVVTGAAALILRAPARDRTVEPILTARGRRVAVGVVTALFLIGSAASTSEFARLWRNFPTAGYLANGRAALADASPAPLLDQPVPEFILGRITYPDNLASRVFGPLPARPPFADATPDLRLFDESGHLVPAQVRRIQTLRSGHGDDCGYFVATGEVTTAPTEGRLIELGWTVRLEYYANRDGELQVSLATGKAVRTPVRRGLNAVFLRLVGGGEYLRLSTTTPDLSVCVPVAVIGDVEPVPR